MSLLVVLDDGKKRGVGGLVRKKKKNKKVTVRVGLLG